MTTTTTPTELWREEHPESEPPKEVLDLVRSGRLTDVSWHNDVSASFIRSEESDAEEYTRRLFVEAPEPEGREFPEMARYFVLEGDNESAYEGDDLDAALAALGVTS